MEPIWVEGEKMVAVDFKFHMGQFVRITFGGLNYNGRINRCIYDAGQQLIYSVVYVADGEVRTGEFYQDELGATE